jgi:hypothetical protein
MTSHTGRLYALALALIVFFLAWALIAARPWTTNTNDARLKALAAREAQLRREATLVNTIVAQRQALYRVRLRARQAQIAQIKASSAAAPTAPAASGPPAVRVVTLPPLTITRSS